METTEKIETPGKISETNVAHPSKDFNIDSFIEKRKEFITKANAIMVEGKDFHNIPVKDKNGNVIKISKSMAKGGAEKVANIFGWQAKFTKDADAIEMLKVPGMVAFICDLEKDGKFMGQGRGAAILSKNMGDPNKTLKMAQKSSFIDAVIRASGLSDFFTQDLEDMNVSDLTPQSAAQPHVQGQSTSKPTIAPQRAESDLRQQFGKPSQRQIETIRNTIVQKGINPDEIHDAGFSGYPDNLTGGRDGTASELISWLFAFQRGLSRGVHRTTPSMKDELPTIQQDDESIRKFNEELDSIR